MTEETQTGFAHRNADGTLDLRTVSPTRRAAQVNALFSRYNVVVTTKHTTAQIADLYERCAMTMGECIVSVTVAEKKGPVPC